MQGNAEGRDESGEQCENLLQLCQQWMMLFPGQQGIFVNAVLRKTGKFWFNDHKKKVAEGTPLSQINSLS